VTASIHSDVVIVALSPCEVLTISCVLDEDKSQVWPELREEFDRLYQVLEEGGYIERELQQHHCLGGGSRH
jgi:hypothetical protein